MLFDSLEFLIFLPIIIGLYYILPFKFRWILLLCASYFFYGSWKIEFLALIAYSTLVDYFAAINISKSLSLFKKRFWLGLSLISNFSLLFYFKYFNFFIGSRNFFLDFQNQHPKINWLTDILEYGIPVGISFYTFQTVGYTLDVYYGKVKPEKHLGKFALFVSYFPQLVAGPIERFSKLHKQIFTHHKIQYANFSNGFRLILFGLFIKMVISDNIAPLVEPIFNNPLLYSQTDNVIGLVLFSIQIYADFHGYSLIAIGVALLMGVNLMDNFKTPYLATSIKSFWSRWHISLSTWFRDYLYIPLGGNKKGYFRWILNILIIFIVSGIWHGANFTFIVWGGIHGIMYLMEQIFAKRYKLKETLLLKFFGLLKTLIVINIAWLFFRSDTLSKAYLSMAKIIGATPTLDTYLSIQAIEKGQQFEDIENTFHNISTISFNALNIGSILIVLLIIFLVSEIWISKKRFDINLSKLPFAIRWLIYAFLIYSIMAFSGSEFYQFIYFQF
jgi:D-alanyl-lipoteichoic acid acyltransferase DltB (MBOAT superfamily)